MAIFLLALLLHVRSMSWGNYQPPGPWLGTDTDILCEILETDYFSKKKLFRKTIFKYGAVPVESFDVKRDPLDSTRCLFGCWDIRPVIEHENRLVKGLVMVETVKFRRIFRTWAPDPPVTKKGKCAKPKKEAKAAILASERECVDLTIPRSSNVVSVSASGDSDGERPGKKPRLDIDLNVPAVEPSFVERMDGPWSLARPESISLTDLNNHRHTETEVHQSSLTWTDDVVAGHTYRACATAGEQRTVAHIYAMTTHSISPEDSLPDSQPPRSSEH